MNFETFEDYCVTILFLIQAKFETIQKRDSLKVFQYQKK